MKIASVTVNRNDGYKDFKRGLIHFKSMTETFDEVNYVDWNSPNGSFMWEIEDKLPKRGKIKHFCISSNIVNQIIFDKNAQKCNESISRNIAIRRSDADWIVSTNIDVIPPTRSELKKLIKGLNEDTFYTISRREAPKEIIGNSKNVKLLREALINIPARHFGARVTPNDDYSLINCCGDFQIAHKNVWNEIKGFEEEMIYACFVDTNIQKKAVLNGFKLEVKYEPAVYHMEHGAYFTSEDGTRTSDENNEGSYKGDTNAYNDAYTWVENFTKTKNTNTWGLSKIIIEHENI
tara:strand:- start:3655 stop:4530 length:876 start_codon:yes stop_codon:yes gene_type:complete